MFFLFGTGFDGIKFLDNYDSSRGKQQAVILPTAPKAARGIDDYSDKIPQHGPFIAYLSNLPYDVDEDEIAEFFGDLKVHSNIICVDSTMIIVF